MAFSPTRMVRVINRLRSTLAKTSPQGPRQNSSKQFLFCPCLPKITTSASAVHTLIRRSQNNAQNWARQSSNNGPGLHIVLLTGTKDEARGDYCEPTHPARFRSLHHKLRDLPHRKNQRSKKFSFELISLIDEAHRIKNGRFSSFRKLSAPSSPGADC